MATSPAQSPLFFLDAVEPLVNFEEAPRRARLSLIHFTIKAYVLNIEMRDCVWHDSFGIPMN